MAEREPAIVVSHVSKAFKLPHERHGSIKSAFLGLLRKRRTFEKQQVLKDVSLEIKQGEFFGIVGRNGSGKSTLLKLLAGIYSPDAGGVVVNGKLTPFIELGVGFNPELTGRENVYLNGALLGFSTKEMAAMYDDIVAFAELEAFMDQKLKNYSSGMQVRLAFSIAIQAKSDILLVDEVLAVGDEAFQRKCLDVFEQYKARKQTIILVTHDMETVRKFCNRAMLINKGEIVELGNPRKVAEKYSQLNQQVIDDEIGKHNDNHQRKSAVKAKLHDGQGKSKSGFLFDEKVFVDIAWDSKAIPAEDIESIGVHLLKLSGEHVTGINSRTGKLGQKWKTQGSIGIDFDLHIQPGTYYLLVEIFKKEGSIIASLHEGLQFSVQDRKMEWSGLVELPHTWHETKDTNI